MLGDVEQIRGAAQRATRLTRQLLIFARSDVVHPEVLSLNEIIAGLEQLLSRTLGEHITLTIAAADGLWPVKADAGQLEQVLVNLAVNARDAMPGGGTLTIDTANITVDEAYAAGPPRPAARPLRPAAGLRHRHRHATRGTRPRVRAVLHHQAQRQGHRARPRHVLRHHHRSRRPRPDLLRARSGHHRHRPAPRHQRRSGQIHGTPPAAAPRGRGETILLVEDEASLQELASRILTRNGYEVRAARTAADAPAIAGDTSQPIDLLLTDVVMPEMLGNEVASRVHAIRPALPVLYMSGYAQPILDTHGAYANQIDLLEKPFTESTLLTRVRRAIDNGTHPTVPAGKT